MCTAVLPRKNRKNYHYKSSLFPNSFPFQLFLCLSRARCCKTENPETLKSLVLLVERNTKVFFLQPSVNIHMKTACNFYTFWSAFRNICAQIFQNAHEMIVWVLAVCCCLQCAVHGQLWRDQKYYFEKCEVGRWVSTPCKVCNNSNNTFLFNLCAMFNYDFWQIFKFYHFAMDLIRVNPSGRTERTFLHCTVNMVEIFSVL